MAEKMGKLRLGPLLGSGGEGSVYALQADSEQAVKLYGEGVDLRQKEAKLRSLLRRKELVGEARSLRLALPRSMIRDSRERVVGFTMPRAEAISLRRALFSRRRVERYFPDMDRLTLCDLGMQLLQSVRHLHMEGILLGDINPSNILVERHDPRYCWIVDLDSVQVDGLPSPVGSAPFTPPRLQKRCFAAVLREPEDEYFSLAILLFMLLMMGKHPYAHIDGDDPARNIARGLFPYTPDGKSDGVPPGVWGTIWSNLSPALREAFTDVFTKGAIVTPAEWIERLETYHAQLKRGELDRSLYPSLRRFDDPVSSRCLFCGAHFADERVVRSLYCDRCAFRLRLTESVRKREDSRRFGEEEEQSPTEFERLLNNALRQ